MGDDDTKRLIRSLSTLSPAHLRHVRRHLPPAYGGVLAHHAGAPLAELLRRSMTATAWKNLMGSEAGHAEPLSADDRFAALSDIYDAAYWLAEAGEVRMVDGDGNTVGGDEELYAWADDAPPDAAEELRFYLGHQGDENALATLYAAQIHAYDEDGRTDDGKVRDMAGKAALHPRTQQRAMYLLADLAFRKGPDEDRAKAFFWAFAAYLHDPAAAQALDLGDNHLLYLVLLTVAERGRLEDFIDEGGVDGLNVEPLFTIDDVNALSLPPGEAPANVRTIFHINKALPRAHPVSGADDDDYSMEEILAAIRMELNADATDDEDDEKPGTRVLTRDEVDALLGDDEEDG